ncbi:MAG TPA: hypothetical protein VGH70_07030 [Bradyrhizobium sp.]
MIKANLSLFALILLGMFAAVWWLVSWFHARVIHSKNAQIESKDAQIELLERQIKAERKKQPSDTRISASHEDAPLMIVTDKHFINQRVVLDGYRYSHCIFENVTLVYNGGPTSLTHNGFKGFVLTSDNHEIASAMRLMFDLGMLKLQGLDEQGPLNPSNPLLFPTSPYSPTTKPETSS